MSMSPGTREHVVAPFLAELNELKLKMSVPLHLVHRRVLLADMVLAEVRDDDLEGMALRSLAEALNELCWSPTDRETIERYVSARQGHLEVVRAG